MGRQELCQLPGHQTINTMTNPMPEQLRSRPHAASAHNLRSVPDYQPIQCPSFAKNSDFVMDSVRSEGGGLFRSIRTLGSAIAVLSAMASPSYAVDTRHDPSSVTCTNPVSGVHWQIVIDYQKKTVDSFPAAITRSEISWFDPRDQGYNTIDRASGELVTAVGSSTGGWLRHNRCSLEQPR